jgi:hypothetical protein
MARRSKVEFIASLDKAKRDELIFVAIWAPVALLSLFLLMQIPGHFKGATHGTRAAVVLLPLLAWSVINLVITAWVTKRRIRVLNLLCPSCGKPLGGRMGQIVIATGNCCHCGAKVVD